jgi:GDP-L-fucose synthase
MEKNAKIYVAGHSGLVGSALMRQLKMQGYKNIVTRTHLELDLINQDAVRNFFTAEKPEYVFLAAAKVGGIYANNTYPAEFIYSNLAIQANVIHQSYLAGVRRLLFLGSSCIYPRDCLQPIKEEALLTGPLEETNRPYALAKIAGIEMCWSYNREYDTQYLSVMPANLYGLGDNYHPENSHVIPALIRKFHEAKLKNYASVNIWGTGTPKREFLYSDDMAEACLLLMNLEDSKFKKILTKEHNLSVHPIINLGSGKDLPIITLARMIKEIIGFNGDIITDQSKPDGTKQKLLDSSKVNNLGWYAKTNLQVGLAKTYENFKLIHSQLD